MSSLFSISSSQQQLAPSTTPDVVLASPMVTAQYDCNDHDHGHGHDHGHDRLPVPRSVRPIACCEPSFSRSTHQTPHPDPVCTICRDVPAIADQCTIPACGHTFCVDCLMSWSAVRPVCPNCKLTYDVLRVRRDILSGTPLTATRCSYLYCSSSSSFSSVQQQTLQQLPQACLPPDLDLDSHPSPDPPAAGHNVEIKLLEQIQEPNRDDTNLNTVDVPVDVLRTATWVTIQPLEPVEEDIAAAFQLLRLSPEESRREVERAALLTGVPTYICEEAEDAAEALFWEQEDRRYSHIYSEDDFVNGSSTRTPRRVLGNRRHGPNGYLASGHMLAVPSQPTGRASDMASASASTTPTRKKKLPVKILHSHEKESRSPVHERKPPSAGGKRTKKVKKNSRAAAEAAPVNTASVIDLSLTATDVDCIDVPSIGPSGDVYNGADLS